MKLFSYLLVTDNGSTPNPFHGNCSLAVCKPAIRRTAKINDWILATGRTHAPTHRRLIFAMQVTEILPLEKYFTDPRFHSKKPDLASPDPHRRAGDNIYSLHNHAWSQLPGPRSPQQMPKDLKGQNALLSTHFYYFGINALPLPPSLHPLIPANQGHRCLFPPDLIEEFLHWLPTQSPPGLHGQPSDPPPPLSPTR